MLNTCKEWPFFSLNHKDIRESLFLYADHRSAMSPALTIDDIIRFLNTIYSRVVVQKLKVIYPDIEVVGTDVNNLIISTTNIDIAKFLYLKSLLCNSRHFYTTFANLFMIHDLYVDSNSTIDYQDNGLGDCGFWRDSLKEALPDVDRRSINIFDIFLALLRYGSRGFPSIAEPNFHERLGDQLFANYIDRTGPEQDYISDHKAFAKARDRYNDYSGLTQLGLTIDTILSDQVPRRSLTRSILSLNNAYSYISENSQKYELLLHPMFDFDIVHELYGGMQTSGSRIASIGNLSHGLFTHILENFGSFTAILDIYKNSIEKSVYFLLFPYKEMLKILCLYISQTFNDYPIFQSSMADNVKTRTELAWCLGKDYGQPAEIVVKPVLAIKKPKKLKVVHHDNPLIEDNTEIVNQLRTAVNNARAARLREALNG
jgi:hypothetical protein